jgi:hypothetical protein
MDPRMMSIPNTLVSAARGGLNGARVLAAYADHKTATRARHLADMRTRHPKFAGWTDEEIVAVTDDAVSQFQSKGGKILEQIVEEALTAEGIPFKAQVNLDANGIIVESRGVTIPDIVFGSPVVGTHIRDYVVMSLKTTSRERAKLDTSWTDKHPPKLFLYATLAADYPVPEKFNETERRKLVCAVPRTKDTRLYKLNFEDITEAIRLAEC